MKKKDILDLEKRQKIYEIIKNNPGINFNEISRESKISKSTMSYHLILLKKRGIVIEYKNGRFLRYYIPNDLDVKYKEILGLLRQKTVRNILLVILTHAAQNVKEISSTLEIHRNTTYKHIIKLYDASVIEVAPVDSRYIYRTDGGLVTHRHIGREKFFRLTSTYIDLIYDAFIIYQETIFKDPTFRYIIDTMYSRTHELPKKIKNRNDMQDDILEKIWEIFPHPYHV